MEIALVLHDVRSVHNVGSIFRTADAAGITKIYLGGITPVPLDRFKKVRPDFAKVSLGSERSVAWESVNGRGAAVSVIGKLKKEGYKIFAVEQSKKSLPYYTAEVLACTRRSKKIALVLGNEVEGLPLSILKMMDMAIEIPMAGKKESLNVAVAFGIVAFRLRYPS